MNLKEAFRYQNKLQALLDEAQGILDCDSNVTNVANTYLRHKVMAEAEDETILDLPQTEYAQQITDIARFMLYLLEEKGRLFAAIRKAKDALDMDMDSEVSLNAARQSVARTFKRMPFLHTPSRVPFPLAGSGQSITFGFTLVRTASSTSRPARSMADAVVQLRSMFALWAAMTARAVFSTLPPERK